MASRYWVGGTATWNATAGTKWATTSGGAGGASVPTSSDNVFFDASSSGVCTIGATSACDSLDCTGFTGTIAGSSALSIAGSLTLAAGMTFSYTGTFTFTSTGAETITTAGKSMPKVNFNGAGGWWQLQDAWAGYSAATITLTAGEFDTNGFNVNVSSTGTNVFTTTGSGAKTLTLGSSVITTRGFVVGGSNLTVAPDSSEIIISSSSSSSNLGAGLQWALITCLDLSLTMGAATEIAQLTLDPASIGTVNVTLGASCVFDYLILTGHGSGHSFFLFSSSFTVDNDLTITGTSATAKAILGSLNTNAAGTFLDGIVPYGPTRTITCNGTVTGQWCNIADITAAGSAGWNLSAITGGSGNLGGCSGITFTTGQNCYWYQNAGSFSDTSKWRTATGGGGSTTRVPLPQDTAIFNSTAFSTPATTITNDITFIPNINFTGVTNSPIFAMTALAQFTGATTLDSSVSLGQSVTDYLMIAPAASCTLTTAGLNFPVSSKVIFVAHGSAALTVSGNFTALNTTSCNYLGISASASVTFNNNFSSSGFTYIGIGAGTSTIASTMAVTGTFTSSAGMQIFNNALTVGSTLTTTSDGIYWSGGNITVTGAISTTQIDMTQTSGTGTGTLTAGGNVTMSSTLKVGLAGILTASVSGATISCTACTISSTGQLITGSGLLTCSSTMTATAGTLTLGSGGMSATTMSISSSTARTINLGSGTISLTSTGTVWNAATTTNLTFNAGTSTISITNTSGTSKTFTGGGLTYATVNIPTGSTGTITLGSNNTIATLTSAGTGSGAILITGSNNITTWNAAGARTYTLTTGTTQTITNWNVNGTAGNLVTIQSSSAGVAANLSKASGTVSADYLSLKDSAAAGGANWYAGANSTNVSGNTGWIFTAPPPPVATMVADTDMTAVGRSTKAAPASLAAAFNASFVGVTLRRGVATMAADTDFAVQAFSGQSPASFTPDTNLTAVGVTGRVSVGTLTANGTLAAIGRSTKAGVATMAADTGLAAVGAARINRVATMAADTNLVVTALTGIGYATFSPDTGLTAVGRALGQGVATLTSSTALAAVGRSTARGAATSAPSAGFAAVGRSTHRAVASIASQGALNVIGRGLANSIGTFTADTDLSITRIALASGTVTIAADTNLSFPGSIFANGAATFSPDSGLAAIGLILRRGAATFSPDTTLAAAGGRKNTTPLDRTFYPPEGEDREIIAVI
jgi:hypothetical protein